MILAMLDSLSASRFQAVKVAGNPILMKDYPVLLENGTVTDRVKCLCLSSLYLI